MTHRRPRQYSDQMQCAHCGRSWDVNDPEPPPCEGVGTEKLRRARQQSGPLKYTQVPVDVRIGLRYVLAESPADVEAAEPFYYHFKKTSKDERQTEALKYAREDALRRISSMFDRSSEGVDVTGNKRV